MRKIQPIKSIITCLLATGALVSATATMQAQAFSYTNCDLVAGFRIIGGASDLVVDLGQVANFEGLAPRTVITMTNLTATQLAAALPTIDGVSWSVAAAMRGNANYSYPLQTIWVTSPRPDIHTAGTVWSDASQGTLGGAASQIDAIGFDAAVYGNGQPAGRDNTFTGILIPPASQYAYSHLMGSHQNYDATFQGVVENTTPIDFDSAGLPSRSVLYRLEPDTYPHGAGTLIGFFDFTPAGTLVFTAGPPPERTAVNGVSTQGNVTTISFPTINLVGYRLRYTDAAGLTTPISSWNIGNHLVGDGSTLSLQDTNSTPTRFYIVEAYY